MGCGRSPRCALRTSVVESPGLLQLPRLAVAAGEEGGGAGVVEDLFLVRVPLDLPPAEHGDLAEQADADGAEADLRRADGLLAAEDAVDEVPS